MAMVLVACRKLILVDLMDNQTVVSSVRGL